MTQSLYPAVRSVITVTAAATQNLTIASGNAGSTEANVKVTYRTGGVFSSLFTNIITNAATSSSTLKYRVGGANGNQVLTIGSAATGEFTDAVNTDALSAGNVVNLQFINGGGGSITFYEWSMLFAPTTSANTVNRLVSSQGFTDTSVNTTYYFPPVNTQSNAASTEANVQFKNKATATLQNMAILVTTNNLSVATCASRVNTAAGNLLVSIGSGVTGSLEDTTHTDSLAVNDLFNWAFNSTVTSTIIFQSIAVDYLTTAGQTHFICGAANPATVLKNVTTFFGVNGFLQADTTEDHYKLLAAAAFTASNLEAYLPANTVSATSTLDFRIDKASGSQTLSIGSNTSGYFEDTTHSDSVTAAQRINYRIVTPNNGTSLTLSYIGCLGAYASAAVTNIGWFPQYSDLSRPNISPQTNFSFQGSLPQPTFNNQWFPCYSDQSRPNLKIQRDFAFDHPLPLNLTMQWQPEFADLGWRPPFVSGVSVFNPPLPLNFMLSWQPDYADQIRPNLKVQREFVFDRPLPLNLPLPWLPDYPDLSRETGRVRGDAAFNPPWPIISAIFWQPEYVDSEREVARVKGDSFFAPQWPLNLPLPWLPEYADLVRESLKVKGDTVFSPAWVILESLTWLPQTGDTIRESARIRSEGTFGFPSAVVAPVVLPWLPQYADLARQGTRVRGDSVFMPPWAVSVSPGGQVIFFFMPDDLGSFIST